MDTKKIIHAALFTPGPKNTWGLPLLFEGRPGTGKTAIIEQIAEQAGLHMEVIIGSIREPSDFGGLPILHDGRTKLAAPAWAFRCQEAKRAVIFGDELNTAMPSVQAAWLRIATDRVVGELALPGTVRILGAQNAVGESAGGWDLAPPLANRFGHITWDVPEAMEWVQWLLGGSTGENAPKPVDAEKTEAWVTEAFPLAYAKAKGLVAGFVRAQPMLLHKQPQPGSPEASKAWPSPRTWELFTRALAGADVHRLDDVDTDVFTSAFVGTAAAASFEKYRAEADLPNPEDVLEGKVKFKHDPKRLDRTQAVLGACAALITGAKDRAKQAGRADVLWTLIGEVAKDATDVAIPAAQAIAKAGFTTSKSASANLAKMAAVLEAAKVQLKA
jgi:MoxR-like ATPase